MKESLFPMKLLLKILIPQVLVLVSMFSLIVVGCTASLSKSQYTSSNEVNGEQNLVSNGDIELLTTNYTSWMILLTGSLHTITVYIMLIDTISTFL